MDAPDEKDVQLTAAAECLVDAQHSETKEEAKKQRKQEKAAKEKLCQYMRDNGLGNMQITDTTEAILIRKVRSIPIVEVVEALLQELGHDTKDMDIGKQLKEIRADLRKELEESEDDVIHDVKLIDSTKDKSKKSKPKRQRNPEENENGDEKEADGERPVKRPRGQKFQRDDAK